MSASPRLIATVRHLLREGRENARKGWLLRERVIAQGVECDCTRRIGEAVASLIEDGLPVCSSSSEGYWLAATAEEIESALAEVEKRARRTLRRRRLLRSALLAKRGQMAIREVA